MSLVYERALLQPYGRLYRSQEAAWIAQVRLHGTHSAALASVDHTHGPTPDPLVIKKHFEYEYDDCDFGQLNGRY